MAAPITAAQLAANRKAAADFTEAASDLAIVTSIVDDQTTVLTSAGMRSSAGVIYSEGMGQWMGAVKDLYTTLSNYADTLNTQANQQQQNEDNNQTIAKRTMLTP